VAGVAPINRDSGAFSGRRKVCGGRARARKDIYMATLVATKHNPILKAFYRRLLAVGETKLVIILAISITTRMEEARRREIIQSSGLKA